MSRRPPIHPRSSGPFSFRLRRYAPCSNSFHQTAATGCKRRTTANRQRRIRRFGTMFSKKQILSAMAAVAMLALPVSAFANDWNHHNWNQHNRAVHNASVNHQIAGNAPVVGSRYAANRYGWTPRAGWNGAPAMRGPINVASPGYSPYAWNRYPHRWFAPASPYQAYAPAYPGYARPTYGYPPVGAMGAANCGPSAGYSGSTPGTSPSWLMTKRYNTMRTIAQLRARGDSRGAARLVPTVTALNQRIG